MPFILKISRCPNNHEFTIYAKPLNDDDIDILWVCEECAREAAEKQKASELRGDEAVGGGGDEPSNVVRAEEAAPVHHVYELIECGPDQAFYVGVTKNPNGRYYEHGAPGSTSAAFPRIQEIRQRGGQYHLNVVASFYDRERAEAYEALLISQSSDLVNRLKPPLRSVTG